MLNGLYDPAMGPMEPLERCKTCGLGFRECPGHAGHIELCVHTYQPLLFDVLERLLRCKCFFCHRLRADKLIIGRFLAQFLLLRAGKAKEAMEVESLIFGATMSRKPGQSGGDRAEVAEGSGLGSGRGDRAGDGDDDGHGDGEDPSRSVKALANLLRRTRSCTERPRPTPFINALRRDLVAAFFRSMPKKCTHCGGISPRVRKDGHSKIFQQGVPKAVRRANERVGLKLRGVLETDEENAPEDTNERLLYPNEVREHLRLLYKREGEILNFITPLVGGAARAAEKFRTFFCKLIVVPPNKFRPARKVGSQVIDHAQNYFLSQLLQINDQMMEMKEELGSDRGGGGQAQATAAKTALAPSPSRRSAKMETTSDEESEGKNQPSNQSLNQSSNPSSNPSGDSKGDAAGAMQRRRPDRRIFVNLWLQMQDTVNTLFDSDKSTNYGGSVAQGIRQILDKKAGLFRQNMMGKRVNYAARSVISPDPYILAREIGVPERFAIQLTYPEPVTPWNAEELRQAILNGPFQHPGANYVVSGEGRTTNLAKLSEDQRRAIALTLTAERLRDGSDGGGAHAEAPGPTRVARHLRDGDVVLMNRQPTLHKPSMMAHKVRVLRGKQYQTLRMHYANCKTFNADFDGDEMNLHFPQNEVARAEAYGLALNDLQYVKPTDGSPLRGLIQDHVDAGVLMCQKNTFFTRGQYQQLLMQACSVLLGPDHRMECAPPAIARPSELWTGKQLIGDLLSFVLHGRQPLNMTGSAKLPNGVWGRGNEAEDTVLFRNGKLLTGILDKSQFGASGKGLVHNVYTLYGAETAGVLLSLLGRLFTRFIQRHGFTCGLDDMLLNEAADAARRESIERGTRAGKAAAAAFAGVVGADASPSAVASALRDKLHDDSAQVALDNVMKSELNKTTSNIIKQCIPQGQSKPFPQNMLALMVLSGAKGSKVNHTQISCLLGQQELEGRRVPMMCSGKTLPSFAPYDPSPRAGGYVTDRFLTGIRPQEYFFHCMAGREGLCDTAVKTSRSGYLQRCLVKHLESLQVQYDYTVRDADGALIQFHYGGDAIDVAHSQHLNRFSFLAENYRALLDKLRPEHALAGLDDRAVARHLKRLKKSGLRPTDADPVMSLFSPGRYIGSVSERFRDDVDVFCKTLPKVSDSLDRPSRKNFKSLMHLNYAQSIACPGESVGVLAAQSVGEPSTQMTLNTFHLAGHGGANVTLGIPRLREIVMTASRDIKTPIMELPLRKGLAGAEARRAAEALAAELSQIRMSSFVSELTVRESVSGGAQIYEVRVRFADANAERARQCNVAEIDFRRGVAEALVPQLLQAINRELKTLDLSQTGDAKESSAAGKASGRGKRTKESKVELPVPGSEGFDRARRAAMQRDRGGDSDAGGDEENGNSADGSGSAYDQPDVDEIEMIRREVEREQSRNQGDEGGDDSEDASNAADGVGSGSGSPDKKIQERLNNLVQDSRGLLRSVAFERASDGCLEARAVLRIAHLSRKLLMSSIVDDVLSNSLLRSVRGIKNCAVLERGGERAKELVIQAEGVNMMVAWQHSGIVDVDRISSNDIGMILETYGVEAARAAIVEQITAVFGVYGISVDPRHLGLIADYMTHEGGYRPLNRIGIDSCTSTFQKVTFETSTTFLTRACLNNAEDYLTGPSSRLVVGAPTRGGTGSFSLLYDHDKASKDARSAAMRTC